MIPKVLHYCWFGGQSLPTSIESCIKSWERLMPDFEIKRWDESNFDVNTFSFAAEAYRLKKYAFVADVCRVQVLYQEGGVYLDTDMLFIQGLDNAFLKNEVFLGWESKDFAAAGIIGSVPKAAVISKICDFYNTCNFPRSDQKELHSLAIPVVLMNILNPLGIASNGEYQKISNLVTVYPVEFFYPKDNLTGYTTLTENTIAIHLYDASWVSEEDKLEHIKYQWTMRLTRAVEDLKNYYTTEEVIQIFRRAAGLSSVKLLGNLIKRAFVKNFKPKA